MTTTADSNRGVFEDTASPLASSQWRHWVRSRPFAAAAVAGLVATQMSTIVGYFLNAVGLPQLNWPAVNGALVLPGGSPGAQFAAGAFVHHIDGVVFAMLFVVLVWRKIPLPNTSLGNVGKGIAYSVVLAVLSTGLLIPYAYFAKIGLDPFSFGLQQLQQPGPTAPTYTGIGWKLPFAILVWHVVFGFFLGALYDPSNDET